jgi:hypothetical protein
LLKLFLFILFCLCHFGLFDKPRKPFWIRINAISYYSPTIFKTIGFTSTSVQLLATGVYSWVKTGATFVFMAVIVDHNGRRTALLVALSEPDLPCSISPFPPKSATVWIQNHHVMRVPTVPWQWSIYTLYSTAFNGTKFLSWFWWDVKVLIMCCSW